MESGTIEGFLQKLVHIFEYPSFSSDQSLPKLREIISKEFEVNLLTDQVAEMNKCLNTDH